MGSSIPPSMALISGPNSPGKSRQAQSFSADNILATYPLTHSQEGIWVDYLADKTSTQYNLTLEWSFGNIDDELFKTHKIVAAIRELTKRHSALRSTIALYKGQPHIWEHHPATTLPVIRMLADPVMNIPEERIGQYLHEPFDLEHEFPVRWYVIEQASSKLLYLVSHHIALDGGSMSTLSSELFDILGTKYHAPDRPSESFSRAHLAEQAWRLTEAYKKAEETCLTQLMGTYPLQWQKEPLHGSHDFRRLQTWAVLPKDVCLELRGLSSRFSTSWFRVTVSLVGLLLHIHTGAPLNSDHSLAVSFGGRPEGFEHTVGQFANPLPVKIPMKEHFLAEQRTLKNTLDSLVASVSRNISQVKKAERLSMLDLSRSWRTKGRLGHFPSPQVAVSFAPALADERCRLFPVEGSWDLFFVFQDGKDAVELGVIYDPEIFNQESMDSMKSTYLSLLDLSKSETPIFVNELPTMPRYLTVPLPGATERFTAVHEMFHMQAISNPSRIALSCAESNHVMSYGELDETSSLKAQVLRLHSIANDTVVILHLQRGFHLIEWIIATLKSGGAYLYLDPKLPADRKRFVIGVAAGPNSVLVTDDELPPDTEWSIDFTGTILSHHQPTELGVSSPDVISKQVDPASLAYIIFTSGSTGEPKGVMIEHGSFAHFVRASVPIYGTGHGSRVLQLASFSFDASVLEWSTALASGGTLCFAETPHALVGDYLADVIEKNAVSFMQITPSALATIPPGRGLSSLRCISVGGEAVPAHLLETWRQRVTVVNSYGPTETSVAVTFQEYTEGGQRVEQVSVGKPPPGTEIYICDPSFARILPSGTEGEICIAGQSPGRGYFQRQALTEAKFATHPKVRKRMYRSGDRGMLNPDGSLVVLGRMDREVKIRGYRISPEEIEAAIMGGDNAVHDVSAQVSPDGLSLIAIVAPETCSTRAFQSSVDRKLPPHMRPSAILPVTSLPKSSSGKIDHTKIKEDLASYIRVGFKKTEKAFSVAKMLPGIEHRAEQDVVDLISKAWQDEIGLSETPSTAVNFFDVGGHSHLVPRLQQRIASAYPSSKVTTLDLFHHSTIKSQARLVFERLDCQNGTPHTEGTCQNTSFVVDGAGPHPQVAHTISVEEADEHKIAIIGISGKFPGANDPDALYENLTRGTSGITDSQLNKPVPEGCTWIPRAGTLSGIEEFDAEFWNLTCEEAADMDPQQRLFLTTTLHALEDAGIDPFSEDSNKIGVFVGAAVDRYHTVTEPVFGDPFQRANRGFVAPSISARTAYHLNLHGPNVTVNTNCASGTVALTLAVDALRNRRCDVAVVGGVSVQLFDGGYTTQPGSIFSMTGHCRPFEEAADGTIPSDAVVSVVLKRASDAVHNGDSAYAFIAGAAYNSDGATNKVGYQVPSPKGQSDAIVAAWKDSRLSPEQLQYIELHGSGTPIGDALELEAVKLSMDQIGCRNEDVYVGSNKGSLGNTQHASGLVSLVKMCKSIQAGTIPAMVGTGKLSPLIMDANLPVRFAYKPIKVKPGTLIGISAAGWGGVNSHVVIQAPAAEVPRKVDKTRSRYRLRNEILSAPRNSGLHEATKTSQDESVSIMSPVTPSFSTSETLDNGRVDNLGPEDLQQDAKLVGASNENSSPKIMESALDLVLREVSRILEVGQGVAVDDDLRAAGLDSLGFVTLARNIKRLGEGFHLPISSFTQPSLTPMTLAAKLEKSSAVPSSALMEDRP